MYFAQNSQSLYTKPKIVSLCIQSLNYALRINYRGFSLVLGHSNSNNTLFQCFWGFLRHHVHRLTHVSFLLSTEEVERERKRRNSRLNWRYSRLNWRYSRLNWRYSRLNWRYSRLNWRYSRLNVKSGLYYQVSKFLWKYCSGTILIF